MKHLVRSLWIVIFALSAGAAEGIDFLPYPCGALYTYNSTDKWIWVTIYDTAKVTHMDWGWVGPHADRRWTGGGSPWPGFNRYLCTIIYHARAEVKEGGPADTPNIFDTTVQVIPGSESANRVCLGQNGKSFYWYTDPYCQKEDPKYDSSTSNAAQKVAAAPPNPAPDPPAANVELLSAHVTPPYGLNSAVYRVGIVVGGKTQPPTLGTLGKWSTTTPDVIQLIDGAGGFRVLKPGAGVVFWNYAGKEYSVKIQAQ